MRVSKGGLTFLNISKTFICLLIPIEKTILFNNNLKKILSKMASLHCPNCMSMTLFHDEITINMPETVGWTHFCEILYINAITNVTSGLIFHTQT